MRMMEGSRLLYCRCAYAEALPAQAKADVERALLESGTEFDVVPDLCGMAAHKSPELSEFAAAPHLTVAACHPRAVQWLFAAAGAPLRDEAVTYLDVRNGSINEVVRTIREMPAAGPGYTAPPLDETPAAGWKPWFPVVDEVRCVNCQQCLGFCLFGVYAVNDEGNVEVKNPSHCKTGCPACARVCPENAIIFPKYANAPINGGDVPAGAQQLEPVKVDKAALLQGDVLQVLRDRGANSGARFTADPAQLRAMQERFVHLGAVPRQPDIPLSALFAKPKSTEQV